MRDLSFQEFIKEQLADIRGLRIRSMFGGAGLYADGYFFAIIFEGKLYCKTNSKTIQRYKDAGMGPFRPSEKQVLKNYYEVPFEVIESSQELLLWAREAIQLSTD